MALFSGTYISPAEKQAWLAEAGVGGICSLAETPGCGHACCDGTECSVHFFPKWMFNILSGTSVTLGYAYPVHSISFNKRQIKKREKKKKRKKEIACAYVCERERGREFKLLNEKQKASTGQG